MSADNLGRPDRPRVTKYTNPDRQLDVLLSVGFFSFGWQDQEAHGCVKGILVLEFFAPRYRLAPLSDGHRTEDILFAGGSSRVFGIVAIIG